VASMSFDPARDDGLVARDASHLFDWSVTRIGFSRGTFLRRYMYDFIELFAPHLDRDRVDRAAAARDDEERDALFEGLVLPEL